VSTLYIPSCFIQKQTTLNLPRPLTSGPRNPTSLAFTHLLQKNHPSSPSISPSPLSLISFPISAPQVAAQIARRAALHRPRRRTGAPPRPRLLPLQTPDPPSADPPTHRTGRASCPGGGARHGDDDQSAAPADLPLPANLHLPLVGSHPVQQSASSLPSSAAFSFSCLGHREILLCPLSGGAEQVMP
jgi:hypothetical protein